MLKLLVILCFVIIISTMFSILQLYLFQNLKWLEERDDMKNKFLYLWCVYALSHNRDIVFLGLLMQIATT